MPFDKFLVKAVEVSRIGLLFPFYSLCYICCPCAPLSKVMVVEMLMTMVVVVMCKKISCWVGQGFPNSKTCVSFIMFVTPLPAYDDDDRQVMRKPFLKFICNSASYFFFLFLLILVSQRIEDIMGCDKDATFLTKKKL